MGSENLGDKVLEQDTGGISSHINKDETGQNLQLCSQLRAKQRVTLNHVRAAEKS